MKILVIKFRHIGDVLLSSVLAKNLKEFYPGSTVDYLVNAESIDMLTLNPNIDNVYGYDRKKAKKSGFFGRISYELSLFKNIIKNRYDIVINTTEGERAYVAELERETGQRMIPIWMTANDELVCPICAPRNERPITNGEYPPAHPNCRCGVGWEFPKDGAL